MSVVWLLLLAGLPPTGANLFNEVETAERLRAASAAGFGVVRIAPDKWHGAGRDFLLGDADDFRGVPAADLKRLREVLDRAHAARLKVVLTMLSLPGCRWKQHHGDQNDFRLYLEPKYQAQARAFWRELAGALKGHPALAGYNLLNEPRPERNPATRGFDLSALYAELVKGIREVDAVTPIILDGSDDASPEGLARLTVLEDPNVIYAFHFYEPWPYIDHKTKGQHRYPGEIDGAKWNVDQVRRAMGPVVAWQKKNALPSSRIWLEEFGVPRTKPGAAAWLRDVLVVAREQGWPWAVYSFREDTWDAMDYELGEKPPSAAYWQAVERGEKHVLPRGENAVWRVISKALGRP